MQKEFEIEPGIIISKLDIKDGDTIIVTIDTDVWSIDEAYEVYKIMTKMYPNNSIVATFKGIEISRLEKEV